MYTGHATLTFVNRLSGFQKHAAPFLPTIFEVLEILKIIDCIRIRLRRYAFPNSP